MVETIIEEVRYLKKFPFLPACSLQAKIYSIFEDPNKGNKGLPYVNMHVLIFMA